MPLQVAIFDFDWTLSVEHVFNLLAGGPPAALTEAGQLQRISELDREYLAQGGFAPAMFGGSSRISRLDEMLSTLRSSGVECLVCTRGLVGPVRKLLEQVNLLKHFTGVYGNTRDTYGCSEYDQRANPGPDIRFAGGPESQLPGSKQRFIQGYMDQRGLTFHDAVFIDDTVDEISNLQGTCQTILVATKGMGPQTFAEVLQLVRQDQRAAEPPGILNPFMSPLVPFQFSAATTPVKPQAMPGPERRQSNGQSCQVFSRQINQWCPATIVGQENDMFHIQYTTPDGQIYSKSLYEGSTEIHMAGSVEEEEDDETPMCELGQRRRDPKRRGRSGACCHQ